MEKAEKITRPEEKISAEANIKSDVKNLAASVEKMSLEELRRKLERIITDIIDSGEKEDVITCEACGFEIGGTPPEECYNCGTKTGFTKPANKGAA